MVIEVLLSIQPTGILLQSRQLIMEPTHRERLCMIVLSAHSVVPQESIQLVAQKQSQTGDLMGGESPTMLILMNFVCPISKGLMLGLPLPITTKTIPQHFMLS